MAQADGLNEWQATREYWALRADPVFRCDGVPLGQGQPVMVLPGLFGNDLYLYTLRDWLSRLGYQPLASNILWNAGCSNRLLAEAERPLTRQLAVQSGPIALIGHSRGGLFAKALASKYADRVSHLILLGSPLGGMLDAGPANMQQYVEAMENSPSSGRRFVFNAGRNVMRMLDPDCDTPLCDCDYMGHLFAPIPEHVKLTSIYSPTDPIVPAEVARMPEAPNVKNIEVAGTHAGLAFNANVYPFIAQALAQSEVQAQT